MLTADLEPMWLLAQWLRLLFCVAVLAFSSGRAETVAGVTGLLRRAICNSVQSLLWCLPSLLWCLNQAPRNHAKAEAQWVFV